MAAICNQLTLLWLKRFADESMFIGNGLNNDSVFANGVSLKNVVMPSTSEDFPVKAYCRFFYHLSSGSVRLTIQSLATEETLLIAGGMR